MVLLPVLLATLGLRPAPPAQESTPAALGSTRPNVVLVLADDMGFSDLGCYGSEIETPHLDGLAANGLRLTQVYNTSKCFPSRACLLTGAYAQQVEMDRGPGVIQGGLTFAEVLREAGYRTLMTGKHHGTENPFERGFDRYFGLRDGACNYFNPGRQRPGEPAPAQKRNNRAWCIDGELHQPYTPEPGFYTTDAFTDRALQFLEETRGREQPFLLYLAYNAPHDPLHAHEADIARYSGRYDEGWAAIRNARVAKQTAIGLFGRPIAASPADYGDWSALDDSARAEEARRMEVYAAMIHCLDRNVGRVVAKLKNLGVFEDTMIVFASDNGGSSEVVRKGTGPIGSMTRWASLQKRWANVSNTPFRRYKNHSHEGGICTPFIVHWPRGVRAPGAFVHTPAHFIDVMPTLVELAGAEYPDENTGVVPMQGVSLTPLLRGAPLEREDPLFWKWAGGRAIREGKWKLVKQGKREWELFDLEADRIEVHDLATEQPDRLKAMAQRWQAWADAVNAEGRP